MTRDTLIKLATVFYYDEFYEVSISYLLKIGFNTQDQVPNDNLINSIYSYKNGYPLPKLRKLLENKSQQELENYVLDGMTSRLDENDLSAKEQLQLAKQAPYYFIYWVSHYYKRRFVSRAALNEVKGKIPELSINRNDYVRSLIVLENDVKGRWKR